MSERTRQLVEIIGLSKEMLAQAREHEWARVAELEASRKTLVMQCFQHTTAEQDVPEVAAAIREILRLNQDVSEIGRQYQEQLVGEIHTGNIGRAATAAYLNCAP
ncbi:MAG TPA: flagellar protein FliT [Gammaproteobacteria bacterium]|nr:flagellar protein FliT [Gammaproteobacteria bacterium]